MPNAGYFKKGRQAFASYFRLIWLEFIIILILGGLTAVIQLLPPVRSERQLLPMWPTRTDFNGNSVFQGPIEYSYPFVPGSIPTWLCTLLVVGVPILSIVAYSLVRKCRAWDIHSAISGLIKALLLVSLCQVVLKKLIGGLRPNYIDFCKPNTKTPDHIVDAVYFYSPAACTANVGHLSYVVTSFPSGHTAASFASATFLSLYINAKFAASSAGLHTSLGLYNIWGFLLIILSFLGAMLIAGTVYLEHQHHLRDIIAGALLGIFVGMLGYRTNYLSLFNEKTNFVDRIEGSRLLGGKHGNAMMSGTSGQTDGVVGPKINSANAAMEEGRMSGAAQP